MQAAVKSLAVRGLGVLVLTLAAVGTAHTAQAATPRDAVRAVAPAAQSSSASAAGRRCQVLLDRPDQRSPETEVVSTQCAGPGRPLVAPLASVPIVVLYENLNYGGASTVIYGGSGYCDATGYSIKSFTSGSWYKRTSSYKYAGGCDYTKSYYYASETGYCQRFFGNVPWVGSTLNDHVYSMHVSAQPIEC